MWIVEAHFPAAGQTFFGPFGIAAAKKFRAQLNKYNEHVPDAEQAKNITIKSLVRASDIEGFLIDFFDKTTGI